MMPYREKRQEFQQGSYPPLPTQEFGEKNEIIIPNVVLIPN
jgi:hypothetical protein